MATVRKQEGTSSQEALRGSTVPLTNNKNIWPSNYERIVSVALSDPVWGSELGN
jgi:hypothetical protein